MKESSGWWTVEWVHIKHTDNKLETKVKRTYLMLIKVLWYISWNNSEARKQTSSRWRNVGLSACDAIARPVVRTWDSGSWECASSKEPCCRCVASSAERARWLTRMGEHLQTSVNKKVRSICNLNVCCPRKQCCMTLRCSTTNHVYDDGCQRKTQQQATTSAPIVEWSLRSGPRTTSASFSVQGEALKCRHRTLEWIVVNLKLVSDARRATEAWEHTSARSNTSNWTNGRTARWPGWKRWDWIGSVKVQKIVWIEVGEFHFEILCQVGNINAKLKYEQWVPPSYRKVDSSTPQVIFPFRTSSLYQIFQTLVEQWIFAKYGREEFIHPERQSYTSGFMEVF